MKEKKQYPKGHWLSLGISIGLVFGAAYGLMLGSIMDNIAIGLAIGPGSGMAIGVGIGTALEEKHNKIIEPDPRLKKKRKTILYILLTCSGLAFLVTLLAFLF